MTQQQNLITIAQSYIGVKSNKKIIDTYNTIRPLPAGYKVKYSDAWCATFVSACAKLAGLTDIIFPECSCPRMIELYKAKDQWQEDESVVPQQGWIAMYDWQDSGSGNNKGTADHVGIVEKVENGKIIVIEGNKGGTVGRRTIDINGKYLRGFCVPKYTTTTPSVIPEIKTTISVGALVNINSDATYYDGGAMPSWVKNQKWFVKSLSGDRAVIGKNQANTSDINSPVNVKYLTLISDSSFAVGDKVRLKAGAPIYGTANKFSEWVYSSTLYVRSIRGSRVVISTVKTGAITGPVNKEYLTKV